MQAKVTPTAMRMLSLLLRTAQEVTGVAVVLDKHTQKNIPVSTACVDKLNARAGILQCPGSSYFCKPAGSCCHEDVLLRSTFSTVHIQVTESLLFWCFVSKQTAVEAASYRGSCSQSEAWLGTLSLTFPSLGKPAGKGEGSAKERVLLLSGWRR